MTSTLGSSKFLPPTTRAAAMFRCAVPKARTPFVPTAGPPRSHPIPTPPRRNRMLAKIPGVPNKPITFCRPRVQRWKTLYGGSCCLWVRVRWAIRGAGLEFLCVLEPSNRRGRLRRQYRSRFQHRVLPPPTVYAVARFYVRLASVLPARAQTRRWAASKKSAQG